MLNRHIDSIIERHYATTKKALLLAGARQTGKTYAIRRYAREAGLQLVEMNFVLQPETRNIPRRAIVLSNDNLSVKDKVLYAPVYMTMFLHHRKKEGAIIYHPELP